MSELVSVRQFAKLDGCSHTLVQKAVREGKLPISADGKLDPALAGSDWRRQNRRGNQGGNTAEVATKVATPPEVATPAQPRVATGPADPVEALTLGDEDFIASVLAGRFMSTAEAERIKENGLAAKNLLAARKEAGDVIDIEVAEAVLFEQARQIRDAWMNWPARVGPLIAAEIGVSADAVLEALNRHVQDQLKDLGEPDPDFAGEQG